MHYQWSCVFMYMYNSIALIKIRSSIFGSQWLKFLFVFIWGIRACGFRISHIANTSKQQHTLLGFLYSIYCSLRCTGRYKKQTRLIFITRLLIVQTFLFTLYESVSLWIFCVNLHWQSIYLFGCHRNWNV